MSPFLAPRPPVRYVPLTQTGQLGQLGPVLPSQPITTNPTTNAAALADAAIERKSFFDSLRDVTPALIITGIAIGIASGIGTTVGSTIGTLLTRRFRGSRPPRKRQK